MLDGIEVLVHSSIRISKNKVIYFDPFNINKNYNDADIVFITHDHYDHYSESDIDKVIKNDTIFVIPDCLYNKLLDKGISSDNIIVLNPNETTNVLGIKIETIPSYNINKTFHLKEYNWLGYIITIDNIRYYIAGDTDITLDNKKVVCDVAFIPVGGVYTMDFREAAELVSIIKPKYAVPIHYGSVVGDKNDGINFINLLDKDIKGIVLMKE